MTSPSSTWLKCSACRHDIAFLAVHYVCSVSTCNRARTRLVFCSVPCWDSHVAILRHREAWAVEERAPDQASWAAAQAATAASESSQSAAPQRRVVGSTDSRPTAAPTSATLATTDRDMLIVVSKLKKYIKDRSGMNCADAVAEVLSDHVRAICDDAIRTAGRNERKTVLDRDVAKPER